MREILRIISNLSAEIPWKGENIWTIKCIECGNMIERLEEYWDWQVQVEGINSLIKSVKESLKREKLQGDNLYNCEICKKKVKI